MWFKNLRPYRLTSAFDLGADALHRRLENQAFTPCAKSQPVSLGWVPPLGEEAGGQLAHAADNRYLLCMRREERILPPAVVREMVQEKVAEIEAEQARKVYRKERLGLQDEIVQDCLPRAFTRSSYVHAFIDRGARWLFVDTASAARAEELLNLLRESVGTLPVALPQVNNAPAATMTAWLQRRDFPGDLVPGSECELREPGEDGGIVRCRGVDLLSGEIEAHLDAGRQVVRLAVEWDERLRLVLDEDLNPRRLRFADQLMKENEDIPEADRAARLDADFALMSSAVVELQQRIITLFGGEAA